MDHKNICVENIYTRCCQSEIPSGAKFKTGTKSSANIDIYGKKKNLPLLLYGFSWGLESKKLVHFCHQLMWNVDPDIYSM